MSDGTNNLNQGSGPILLTTQEKMFQALENLNKAVIEIDIRQKNLLFAVDAILTKFGITDAEVQSILEAKYSKIINRVSESGPQESGTVASDS